MQYYRALRGLLILYLSFTGVVQSGGFVAGTLVKVPNDIYKPIEQLRKGDHVICFDFEGNCIESTVADLHQKEISRFFAIVIQGNEIIVADDHLFYSPSEKAWKQARNLKQGDVLLKNCLELVSVDYIRELSRCAIAYDITVEGYHNFCVSNQDILVHNIAPFVVLGITWTIGEGVKIAGGIGLGALLLGTTIYQSNKNAQQHYFSNVRYGNEEKGYYSVPEQPTEEDGFFPPKRWDGKKVRHPITGQHGWPDGRGRVWVPSGVKGHGGPHWDIIDPDGDRVNNVYPGGKSRPPK